MTTRPPVKAMIQVALIVLTATGLTACDLAPSGRPLPAKAAYPYRSPSFAALIRDSVGSEPEAERFYDWLSTAYQKRAVRFSDNPKLSLNDYLKFKRLQLSQVEHDPTRVKLERKFSSELFRMVKSAIPKFSLDRGFEFSNTMVRGERQCFLQSVLIAGILQSVGIPSGVVMVNCNERGEETNNKHACTIVRLSNGHDIMIDASDDLPFAHHQGLFMSSTKGGYRFVSPIFNQSDEITRYRPYKGVTSNPPTAYSPLDHAFVRSQFEYYRGERTAGGVMSAQKTKAGIAEAAKHLERSVELCSDNPLAMYMLGKVYKMAGRDAEARWRLEDAEAIYTESGWVPPDEKTALASVQ